MSEIKPREATQPASVTSTGPIRAQTTVGTTTVIAIEDSAGAFFRRRSEAFPDATAAQWELADRHDPGAVLDGQWMLRFRAYAIRLDDGTTIMVDAGVGPPGSPAGVWAPAHGWLPDELQAAGIEPDQVSIVVLTHLHADHTGWAVAADKPFFRNARYVLQKIEHDHIGNAVRRNVIEPLRAADQLSLVDGEERLASGIRVIHTPGHTPGHQSLLVDSQSDTLAITGDVLVHMVQLLHPEIGYVYEADGDDAQSTRQALLNDLAARRSTLATAHLSEPFLVLPIS